MVENNMDLQELSKYLRLILYKNMDCETLTTEFERVLKEHEYEVTINIFDERDAVVIDIDPLIQLIRLKKKDPVRVYEVIPFSSPLRNNFKKHRTHIR